MTTRRPTFRRRPLHLALLAALLPAGLMPLASQAQSVEDERTLELLRRNQQQFSTTLPTIHQVGQREHETRSEQQRGYTVRRSRSGTGLSLPPREIPQSLTVITHERIADSAAGSLADVIRLTPGISVSTYDSRGVNFRVRGFPVDNILIDGTPVEWSGPWSAGESRDDTILLDRIEVIRGASGLLTGSGEPSAAINQIRKHADSRDFSGSAGLQLGSWKERSVHADLGTGLDADGRIRARLVAQQRSSESFIDFEKNRRRTFYGVIDADLGTDTTLSIGFSQQHDKPEGGMWGGLPTWHDDGSRTDWPRSKTTAPHWARWGSKTRTYFLALKQPVDEWQLQLDLNQIRRDAEARLLWLTGRPNRETGLGMQASSRAWYDTSRKHDHLALQASRPFISEGREHEIAFGISRSQLDFSADSRDAEGDAPPVGNFNTWDGSYPFPATWSAPYLASAEKTTQTSAWAVARLHLDDPLRLILGSRISNWEREVPVARFNDTAYTISHKRKLTPYAGLIYDISPDTSAYYSYTTIFKPQDAQDRYGNYLEPLKGKSHEFGLKGEALDGRLQSTLAFFKVSQDNLAQADGDHLVPGTTSQAQYAARGTTTKGYELEIVGQISPQWLMSLGWTQFKARDAEDKEIGTNHPRRLLKLSAKYNLAGEWTGLALGGDIQWEGLRYAEVTNPVTRAAERLEQPSHTLLNLMAQYRIDQHWQLQFNVDNVLDKKYYSSVGFYNAYTWGQPRRYLLSLDYRF